MTLLADSGRDFGAPAPPGRALSLPALERGGFGLVVATIFAPAGTVKGERPKTVARRQLACYDELLFRFEERLFRVESRGDLSLPKAGGPIGVVHLMEGADPLDSPGDLAAYADQGVRFVGLAWNTPNRWSGGTEDDGGVTDAGRELLAAMAEEGMVPDLSHLNPKAFDEVMAATPGLVVASHSNAHALMPHRRNLTDAQLRAIAARGGVVGVMLYGPVLTEGRATIEHVVHHIEHIAEIAGIAHVGVGSDLDGGFTTDMAPDGIASAADIPRLGEALRRRGWAEEDVDAVMGRNWLRAVEQALPE
jgi:membrane dipeptidase